MYKCEVFKLFISAHENVGYHLCCFTEFWGLDLTRLAWITLNHSYSFPLVVHQVHPTLQNSQITVEIYSALFLFILIEVLPALNIFGWYEKFLQVFGLFISGFDILCKTTDLRMIVWGMSMYLLSTSIVNVHVCSVKWGQ